MESPRLNGDRPDLDLVNHPPHYNAHPSGVEAVEVCEYMPFNVGNAVKYIWRAGLKGPELEDLRKAAWYLRRQASLERAWSESLIRRLLARLGVYSDPCDWSLSPVAELVDRVVRTSHGTLLREVLECLVDRDIDTALLIVEDEVRRAST